MNRNENEFCQVFDLKTFEKRSVVRRKRRSLTLEEFNSVLHLSQKDAAEQLNVCISSLKRQFKKVFPQRKWPSPSERKSGCSSIPNEILKEKLNKLINENEAYLTGDDSSLQAKHDKFNEETIELEEISNSISRVGGNNIGSMQTNEARSSTISVLNNDNTLNREFEVEKSSFHELFHESKQSDSIFSKESRTQSKYFFDNSNKTVENLEYSAEQASSSTRQFSELTIANEKGTTSLEPEPPSLNFLTSPSGFQSFRNQALLTQGINFTSALSPEVNRGAIIKDIFGIRGPWQEFRHFSTNEKLMILTDVFGNVIAISKPLLDVLGYTFQTFNYPQHIAMRFFKIFRIEYLSVLLFKLMSNNVKFLCYTDSLLDVEQKQHRFKIICQPYNMENECIWWKFEYISSEEAFSIQIDNMRYSNEVEAGGIAEHLLAIQIMSSYVNLPLSHDAYIEGILNFTHHYGQ